LTSISSRQRSAVSGRLLAEQNERAWNP